MPWASNVYSIQVMIDCRPQRVAHCSTYKNSNMPNTYSQIYIQIIFAVKNRQALLRAEWDEELYRYITGIIQKKGQKMLAINGTSDHIHFLIGMRPSCCLSDLVREVRSHLTILLKRTGSRNSTSAGRRFSERFPMVIAVRCSV
jgi:REP element-mobilizing transposase RayT